MEVNPVVLPVRVDTSQVAQGQSALRALGEDIRRVQAAAQGPAPMPNATLPGVPGPVAGPTVTGAPQHATQSALRELAVLESGFKTTTQALGKVNMQAELLAQRLARLEAGGGGFGGGGGGGGGGPHAPSSVPIPGGGWRGGGDGGGSVAESIAYRVGHFLGTALTSVGIGALITNQMTHWATRGRDTAARTTTMMIGAGGSVADYDDFLGKATGPSRAGTFVGPDAALAIADPLARMGYPRRRLGAAAETLGAAGLYGYGSAEAGVQFTDLYRTTRSEQVPQLLAALVRMGEAEGRNVGELVQQSAALNAYLRQTQGQYVRGPAELATMGGLQRWMTNLPDRVGEGAAGVDILQNLTRFGLNGGLPEILARRAYMKATGKPWPRTPEESARFRHWAEQPENVPAKTNEALDFYGPEMPYSAAEILAQGQPSNKYLRIARKGRLPNVRSLELPHDTIDVSRYATAGPGVLAGAVAGGLLTDPQAIMEDAVRRWRDTTGGRALAAEAERGRVDAHPGRLADWLSQWQQFEAENPYSALGLQAGAFGGAVGLGWRAWQAWRAARGVGAVAATGAGVIPDILGGRKGGQGIAMSRARHVQALAARGTTELGAGAAAAAAAASRLPGPIANTFAWARFGLSALPLGKDLLWDPLMGGDATNADDLRWGGGGALAAMLAAGALAPFTGGVSLAGLAAAGVGGYGYGRLAQALWPSDADAARGPASLGRPAMHGGRVDLHSEFFRQIERQYGIPRGVMSALGEVESSGNPRARPIDPATGQPLSSAVGLFQFLKGTGRRYGLVGDGFDRREDPVASTHAAARMLVDHRQALGSWEAAIGAHYGGQGNPSAMYARKVLRRLEKYSGDGPGSPSLYADAPDGAVAGAVAGSMMSGPGLGDERRATVDLVLHAPDGWRMSYVSDDPSVTVRENR